jgi:hypothetical protein
MKTQLLLTTLIALAMSFPGGLRLLAATYHVDGTNPSASDSNPGTLAAPWRTIGRANQSVSPGDTVEIKQGTLSFPPKFGPLVK